MISNHDFSIMLSLATWSFFRWFIPPPPPNHWKLSVMPCIFEFSVSDCIYWEIAQVRCFSLFAPAPPPARNYLNYKNITEIIVGSMVISTVSLIDSVIWTEPRCLGQNKQGIHNCCLTRATALNQKQGNFTNPLWKSTRLHQIKGTGIRLSVLCDHWRACLQVSISQKEKINDCSVNMGKYFIGNSGIKRQCRGLSGKLQIWAENLPIGCENP